MKILKNKKGLTLIELIVGILMFIIIAIVVSTSLAPILFSYVRANDFAEYNTLLDNIANQIIGDMAQSTEEPKFTSGWVVDNTGRLTITTKSRIVTYTVENTLADVGGVLQVGGVTAGVDEDDDPIILDDFRDVFSADFYKNKVISFRVDKDTGPLIAYILTVRLRENSTLGNIFEIEREYAVRPIMLNQT